AKSGLRVHLTLIGDGRLRPRFEILARRFGIDQLVTFKGSIPWGKGVFEMLDQADLFLFCSLSEGLGKALLEAMARGLPAIGSAVGGIPELLFPEALVPPADAESLARKIKLLAATPNLLSHWSTRNYERP